MASRPRWSRASGAHASDAPAAGDADDDHPFAVDAGERYDEVAELGRGGMGTVVAALDRRLGREVALKRMAGAAGDRAAAAARFAREAEITASLDHPAIVPIYDAGLGPDGEPFYTMRLVRGRTLSAAIADAADPRARLALVRAFLAACGAVAHAHRRGVVHRDLKPDNILVGELGDTQVVDWGVARVLGAGPDGAHGGAAAAATLTVAGAVIGTPAYMSPEQARGAAADAKADVWSLGAVLFEIVAGRPLVDGAAATTRGEPAAPPAPALPADAPPELAAIVLRALARDPAARYPDAGALAADVASYLDGRPVAAHRYSPLDELRRWARRRRAPLTVAAAALVVLLAAWAWALVRTRAERDRARAAERTAIAARDDAADALGRALVEQALTAALGDAQAEAEVLAAHALTLGDSPEARGVLAAFAFTGRPALRESVELPACELVRPGPDGAVLCLDGGALAVLAGRPLAARWRTAPRYQAATWLDGGRTIAAVRDDGVAVLLDPADGRERAVVTHTLTSRSFGASAGGHLTTAIDNAQVDLLDGERGVVRRVTPCERYHGHQTATVSSDDRVAVTCRHGAIAVLDRDGAVLRYLQAELADGADLAAAVVAPGGRRLALASLTGELQTIDLVTGAVIARRRADVGVVRAIVFAPDGEEVALLGDLGGASVWSSTTWALRRRLPAARDQAVAWSADGGELVTAGRRLRRWTIDRAAPAARLASPHPPGLAFADLAADGARLVTAAGDGTMAVVDVRTGADLLVDRFQDAVLKGAAFLPDGGVLAWSAGTPAVRRYGADLRIAETVPLINAKRAALLPSGWLVTAPYLAELQLSAPARPPPVSHAIEQVIDLDQAPDRARLLALTRAGDLVAIDDGAPPRVRQLATRAGAVAAAIGPGGGLLAIARDRELELVDGATGVGRRVIAGGGARIFDVALSPDGALVAAGDGDRRARVWSVADGRLLASLVGHGDRVVSVRFSPDGRWLTTASWDGTARVWGMADLARPPADVAAEAERAWGVTAAEASAAPLR